jgi:hypothetical protein
MQRDTTRQPAVNCSVLVAWPLLLRVRLKAWQLLLSVHHLLNLRNHLLDAGAIPNVHSQHGANQGS